MASLAELTDTYNDPMGATPLPVEPMVGSVPLSPDGKRRVYIEPPPETPAEPSALSSNVDKIINALFRDDDKRLQLWPEKVVRSGLSAAKDAMSGEVPQWAIDPATGDVHTSPQMIERAMDMSALAGTGGLAGTTDATLGATPFLRPALKYKDRLYKGKEGQQHMDVIPNELYPEFQQMAMNGEDISHYNFGYHNDKGQFLNREKALEYGINTGIIDPQAGKFGALTSTMLADSSKPGTAIEAMAKTAPTFYSAVEHNLNAIPQAKMTGEQWLGTLANKPGVKAEELQWTGLKDFLEENKGKPVTKEQIQEHLANNKVELKEVNREHSPATYNKNTGMPNKTLKDDQLPTKYHSYQLPGGPLSRDTEILTNKGWKRIDVVEVGDVVMTRKDEAGILEWQPVQATPKVYAENLYHFFSQSINMRVTENHQMIAKKRRRSGNNELQRLTAKELWGKSEMLVPLTGVWNGGETDKIFGFDPHDLAELFGWYLAEGSYKRDGDVKNTIQIAQCREYNPEKCDRIEALLNRMRIAWKYYGEAYGIGVKTLNKDLVALFHEQPTSEFKFVPYFFFEQSKSVIQSLLDGLILGDGCTSEQEGRLDKTTFFTKSEQLAGDVQILILMVGKNANVRQRSSGLYCVGIKSKEWSSVDEAKFEIAPYNDFAFCVTVENHAIYVRRNGVAAFTGNSNYREMLLTLPRKEITTGDVAQKLFKRDMKNLDESERQAVSDEMRRLHENKITPTDYRSSHWNEPNILAHVRMNDRTIDGKKSLHLEEIQSDWHQQGRDKGYKLPVEEAKKLENRRLELEKEGGDLRAAGKEIPEAIKKEWVDVMNKLQPKNTVRVPDAPFKKNWHELALKRMIREAAEKGYDRLSWTPGEAQAARYNLSKQVDTIQATKLPDGTYNVHARPLNDAGFSSIGERVPENKLADIVGKDLAEKISKQNVDKASSYKGVDLKIGGEGMKGFYDQIIPKALEKIGKEHGVKVSTSTIDVGKVIKNFDRTFEAFDANGRSIGRFQNKPEAIKAQQQTVHYIDIPQSLKDQALNRGFPLFSAGGYMLVPVVGNPFEKKEND